MKKEKRKSTRWLMGGLAALTFMSTGSVAAAQTVTSYNDLAWGTGQLETNITKFTSPNGGSGLPDSGSLVNFATGNPTSVTLTVTGGDFTGDVQAGQGANPTAGDAFAIFDGKVNAQGVISYIDVSGSNLVLTFTGMNQNSTYDLTFFSDRGANGWDRASLVTLSTGVGGGRTNISSAASDNPVGGVIFSGPSDNSTRLPSDNPNGYVARWNEIKSGSDGMIVLTISFDGSVGEQFKGKYASAIRLIETGSGGNISKFGDLDGDGKDDIVWHHATTGEVSVWLGNGLTLGSTAVIATVSDLGWAIKGVGDVDGDGKDDIVWRHATTGEVSVWSGNGLTLGSTAVIATVSDLGWVIKGVGDVDGDGKDDIVWRHATTGEVSVWLGNGLTLGSTAVIATVSDLGWAIRGVGDVDGDGKDDIVWRHATTGEVSVWSGNGLMLGSTAVIATVSDLGWVIKGVGDVDGDGKDDIVWHHATTGEVSVWLGNGLTLGSTAVIATVSDLGWAIRGVGDVDGDGKDDIGWRHATTGEVSVWLGNGLTLGSTAVIASGVSSDWQIKP